MEVTRKGYYTITGPDGVLLTKQDGSLLQVTTRDEAYEYITDDAKEYDSEEGTYTIHCPDREVLRTDLSTHQIVPADDVAPRIISTPSVSFTVGTPDTYDMSEHVQDDGRSALTYTLTGTLDASLTFNEQTGLLEYDGTSGTTYSLTLTATDAVGSATSSSFNITIQEAGQLLAFPTAVGEGRNTVGGRGGQTIKVTNLNDSGAGSFREACLTSGPRIITFEVSGIINLTSGQIYVTNDNITIAGQTSPGGVMVTGDTVRFDCSEVIMRHMRYRVNNHGPSSPETLDSLILLGPNSGTLYDENMVIDHCSIGWGIDECLNIGRSLRGVTVQKCLVHQGIISGGHPSGSHSKGILCSYKEGADSEVTLYRNAVLNCDDRVPECTGSSTYSAQPSTVTTINCVAYNWYGGLTMKSVVGNGGEIQTNWMHNYCDDDGPRSNTDGVYELSVQPGGTPAPTVYADGNIGATRSTQTGSEWVVQGRPSPLASWAFVLLSEDWRQLTPWPTSQPLPTIETMTLTLANEIVADAGATIPSRDSVDLENVDSWTNKTDASVATGKSYPADFPTYPNPAAPDNIMNDGIADSWKVTNGLDVNTDYSGVTSDDGHYDWLERYLNELAGD